MTDTGSRPANRRGKAAAPAPSDDGRANAARPTASVKWWALMSGVTGVVANVFLLLFYVTVKPWDEAPGPFGWFGRANDTLVVVQYLALVPVILGLERLMSDDVRARAWTRVGLAACIAIIVLQVLLLAWVLSFDIQIVPVGLSVIATVCWAGAISSAGSRTSTLPRSVTRLGRFLAVALPVGAAVFAIGFLVALVSDLSWAWVAGGLPGFAIWFLFPVWTLLLAVAPARAGRPH